MADETSEYEQSDLGPEWEDVGPWHCGLCGGTTEDCKCGEPLVLIVRVPGLTPSESDHDLVAMSLVAMLNDQRVENYEGPEGSGPAPIRLLASGWNTAEGAYFGSNQQPQGDKP